MIYQNNMEIKCIITDDEPIARKGLRRHIGKIDFLTIVGECEDAIQLNNFLDIEMPDMSGLDFLESAQNTPKVIITSAYERYALRGYEFDVVDYLLKPISFSRFLKSVNKAHALMESTSKSEEPAYIFVKTEKQLKRLYLKEIQFIEGMENYIVIHTLTSKEIVHLRLKSIQETLPAQIFMQVLRSFIVNLSYVQAIEGNLLIIGEHKIPVSRPLREEVYKSIVNNQLIQR